MPVEISTTFVMFHVFKDGVNDSSRFIDYAASSIRLIYPKANVVLLTNVSLSELLLPSFVTVNLIDVDFTKLMLCRVREYKNFIERAVGQHVIFCDSDMLFLRPLGEMMVKDYDVAFALRRNKTQPINGGLYFVNLHHRDRIQRFFAQLVDTFEALLADVHYWGDQIALSKLLAPNAAKLHRSLDTIWNGVRIRYLPSRVYNNTPRPWLLRNKLFLPFAKILHFKGPRKHAIEGYRNRYITSLLGSLIRRLT